MRKPSSRPCRRSPTRARPSRQGALGALLAFACAAALAATPDARKADLKERRGEIRERIETLQRDLAKTEESRASAADRLRETESAISDANRNLHRLGEKRSAIQGEVRGLESQSRRLAEQTALQQEHLSRLLYRHYTDGSKVEIDALNLLLSGRDPNQTALDYQYLKALSQAKADLIDDLRTKGREKKRLADAAREKNTELEAIEEKQRQARGHLVAQQKQRQVLLAQTAEKIKTQRKEIGTLQRDEKRLGELIAKLASAAKRTARPKPQKKPSASVRNERTPDPAQAGGDFAALRGKLALPVRGEISGRFGKARPEGGTTWKGLFIRAAEGVEVRAVAGGEVVFADWLRGFGNLLVVDHGDDFLSVYGNNQSLLKEAGQRVGPGEVVATVGNTGGNPDSGLYFELRHQGQAFDPIRWVRLR
jgi:septal ring factor EnvC (AmiA/AmiB activator)